MFIPVICSVDRAGDRTLLVVLVVKQMNLAAVQIQQYGTVKSVSCSADITQPSVNIDIEINLTFKTWPMSELLSLNVPM